jgi:hypothetical protein
MIYIVDNFIHCFEKPGAGAEVITFPIFLNRLHINKGNNKITELRTILQRENQNSQV